MVLVHYGMTYLIKHPAPPNADSFYLGLYAHAALGVYATLADSLIDHVIDATATYVLWIRIRNYFPTNLEQGTSQSPTGSNAGGRPVLTDHRAGRQKLKLYMTAFDTYGGHWMAIAFSLAPCAEVPVTTRDPGCSRRTFPNYFDVLSTFVKN
ncbi:5-enolpyruvylshikimate-3-phosphate synthase [Hordeum vulgare]|nr:5-enolpyruvylshikimate-3-phosphate synthase [Hordeum vulgare]